MKTSDDYAENLLLKLWQMVESGNYNARLFEEVREYLDCGGLLPEHEDQ